MGQAEKIFRQHDEAPTVTSSTLYRQLTLDWVNLHTPPATTATVKRWGRAEPVLAAYARPCDVVDAIDAADNDGKNAILLALLRLMRDDDVLAARTLLQAMLPGLATLASRTAAKHPTGDPDAAESMRQLVLEEFWEVASAYPIERRRHRVAANLILDTLKRVTRHLGEPAATPFDPTPLFTDAAPSNDFEIYREVQRQGASTTAAAPSAGIDADSDLLTVIAWGVQENAISRDDGQLLAAVYLPEKTRGWGFDEAAASLGASRASIKMRCSRAAAKLAAAIRADGPGAGHCVTT